MDAAHSQQQKLPNIMCGDHPSFITSEVPELASDDSKSELEQLKEKDKKLILYHNISPCTSRSERMARAVSEQALRSYGKAELEFGGLEARLPGPNRSLVHAAWGSARWAPHAVLVLALALLVTHALHALAAALHAALPPLRKLCQYCRRWTEQAWRAAATETASTGGRAYPLGVALLTAALYALYFALYVLYCVNIWAIEPLYQDERDERASYDADVKVTNYEDIPPRPAKRD